MRKRKYDELMDSNINNIVQNSRKDIKISYNPFTVNNIIIPTPKKLSDIYMEQQQIQQQLYLQQQQLYLQQNMMMMMPNGYNYFQQLQQMQYLQQYPMKMYQNNHGGFMVNVRHNNIQNANAENQCDICFKTFSRYRNLVRHKQIHTGRKPHKCQYCGKRFNRKDNMVTHERTHLRKLRKAAENLASVSLGAPKTEVVNAQLKTEVVNAQPKTEAVVSNIDVKTEVINVPKD